MTNLFLLALAAVAALSFFKVLTGTVLYVALGVVLFGLVSGYFTKPAQPVQELETPEDSMESFCN